MDLSANSTPSAAVRDPDSKTSFYLDLGQREREVMEVVRKLGSASVRQVCERLGAKLAYTTVLTLIFRLFKKGMLQRRKDHRTRTFIYSAILSAREMEERRAAEIIHLFFSASIQQPELLLSCLVDAVHHYDTELLNHLESRIRAARAAGAYRESSVQHGFRTPGNTPNLQP